MIKNNENITEKSMQIWSWTQKRPKIQQKSILGGSWAVLGQGLGPSWMLLAASWPLLGRSKSSFFQTLAHNGLQEGFWMDFGSLCGHFGKVLGGFWEGLGKNLGGFWFF